LRKLQLVQNSAARLVTYTSRFEHITPVLRELHWLPVEKRVIFKVLLLTYKALNGMGPIYLTELLQPVRPSRTLRSSARSLQLVVPRTKHSWGDRAFVNAAPKLWNSLPESIKNAGTLTAFKQQLKTFLFQ
jgi:hypothetical protein